MLFSQLTFPFLVVTMVGHSNAQLNDIPICKPPALGCSMFKRSVCEWSDSGEPVWGCRGYFETASTGPKNPQQKYSDDKDGNDEEVTFGTLEYQVPQGSKKVVQHDSESDDVRFITYTYPTKSKNTKGTDSKAESESEAAVGTYTLPVSSGKSSSPSKVKHGSAGVRVGTYSLPVAGIRNGEAGGGTNSNIQLGTHAYQVPAIKKSLASKVETGSDVEIGKYVLPLRTDKSNYVSHDDSNSSDAHFAIQVPTKKEKSSESNFESDYVQIGTYNLPVAGISRSDKVAPAEANSDVQEGTYQIPSSKTTTSEYKAESEMQVGTLALPVSSGKSSPISKVESDTEMKVPIGEYNVPHALKNSGEAVSVDSDSEVEMVTYTYQVPTVELSSSSQSASKATIQMDTYTTSLRNGSGTVHRESESSTSNESTSDSSSAESESDVRIATYNYPISSGKSESSRENSESRFNQVLSGKNIQAARDDSYSKLPAEQYFNEASTETSDSHVSATSEVKTGTVSSMSSETNSTADSEAQSGRGSVIQSVSNAQLYHSQINGNAGSIHAKRTNSQNGVSQYTSGERNVDGNYGYSARGADGSRTSVNQAPSMGNIMSPYHLTSVKSAVGTGQHQQAQANSAALSGSVHQKYGPGTNTGHPFGFPYYGYGGYQSLEQGSASESSKQLASSGNGMYPWPQSWTPLFNMELGGYGANWLVGHRTPVIDPPFNSIIPQQSMAHSTNSGFYGSRRMNSGSENAATSSMSSHHSPWFYASPFSQYSSSRALGTPSIDLKSCSFCKKLMAIFGGAGVCDDLEPVILEFFNKVVDILRKR